MPLRQLLTTASLDRGHYWGGQVQVPRQALTKGGGRAYGPNPPAPFPYREGGASYRGEGGGVTAAITRAHTETSRIKAVLDPYNPAGSTIHVNFTTSKISRWQTDSRLCHINWVILDSDWEAEFCRVVEAHTRVRAYVKNHSLGFDVPYRYGSQPRIYRPDFIVRVDDGHGGADLLNLVVEIKGYRGEDAKEKRPRWKLTGCPASTSWAPTAAGPLPS